MESSKFQFSDIVDYSRHVETGLSIFGNAADASELISIIALDYRKSLITLEKFGKNNNLSVLRYSRSASAFAGRLGTAGGILSASLAHMIIIKEIFQELL